MWILTISNISDVFKFGNLIYNEYLNKNIEDSTLVLKRKYLIFKEINKYVQKHKTKINNKTKNLELKTQIEKIKNLYFKENKTYKEISELYEVSIDTIYRIIKNKNKKLYIS